MAKQIAAVNGHSHFWSRFRNFVHVFFDSDTYCLVWLAFRNLFKNSRAAEEAEAAKKSHSRAAKAS
jgi:hypothetical protein